MHLSETVIAPEEVANRPRKVRQNPRGSLLARFAEPEIPEELRHSAVWAQDVAAAFRDLRARCEEERQQAEQRGETAAPFSVDIWQQKLSTDRPSMPMLAAQDL